MADLRLRVGAFTAIKSATDANATRILQAMLAQKGYDISTMTGQQQAEAVLAILIEFINQSAIAYEIDEAMNEARQAVISAPPSFNGA